MPLQPGDRVGPYEILSALGAGGMGEVYRARDTKLDRHVAIKILPAGLVSDAERVARFQREAKTLASLNHPNIAQIYGLEDAPSGGSRVHALAMEFVGGEDLARCLARGPLSVEDAVAIARQLVDALEAAHELGIVHRDLKPSNIKVRSDGAVKVLDFGLAKALEPSAVSTTAVANSPTITNVHTHAGVILGTAAYMAPEQAKGRIVDRRADIWAFGVVLYELLAGACPFGADSTSEILARVIEREPDWSRLPVTTPPAIVRLLHRCLQKDPRRRLQAIADARLELDDSEVVSPSSATPRPSRTRAPVPWLVAAASLVLSAIFGLMTLRTRTTLPRPAAVSAAINLPDGRYLDGFGPPAVALSADGRTIAFLAREGNRPQQLYVRALDDPRAKAVPNSATAEGPFFSPDGRWIAFAVGVSGLPALRPELRKYSLETGLTQTVAPVEDYFGGVWTKDDNLIFVGAQPRGLWKVPAGGGTPQNIVPKVRLAGEETERGIAWPALLPDERAVLVSDWDDEKVAVVDLATRDMVHVGVAGHGGRYVANGYLVYAFENELRAITFNASARQAIGTPVTIVQDIAYGRNKAPIFAMSEEGTLVYATGYLRGSRREPMRLVRVKEGTLTPLSVAPQLISRAFVLSPDGSRLAVNSETTPVVLLIDVKRGTTIRLENAGLMEVDSLAWSPDGRQLAVAGAVPGKGWWAANVMNVDGSGKPEPLMPPENIEMRLAGWTPDGESLIAYGGRPMQTRMDIMRVRRGKPREVLHIEAGWIVAGSVSPNGQWLAYDSNATGSYEVYLLSLSHPQQRIPVTATGGTYPLWRPDGRELVFRRDRAVLAVPVTTAGSRIDLGAERRLFEWDTEPVWAIAADGQIYSMEPAPGAARQTSIELKTGWFAELKRLIR